MIARLNLYRAQSRLTFEGGASLPVVFTALSAMHATIEDDALWLRGRRRGHPTIGPFTPGGLVLAARRRIWGLRVWYDVVDRRRDEVADWAQAIVEAIP